MRRVHPTARPILLGSLVAILSTASVRGQTTFTFGGYVKMDAISSRFYDGSVPRSSALRDIHLPSAIPVGGDSDVFLTNDYHAKESRFNLGTSTVAGGRQLRAFVEMDFLLAGQGDERVSNSYNPRLRHFYFAYGGWLFGQTWTTFQILELPEDLDFAGAADGIVFNRQPQIRFAAGSWQFAIENSATTLTPYGGGDRLDSPSSFSPDLVVRYNAGGSWGTLSIAGILRQLAHEYEEGDVTRSERTFGFGVTAGGRVNVGSRDDVRLQATAGKGLGRYVALNFANGGVVNELDGVVALPSYLGFVSFRHFWSPKVRTNVNVSGIVVQNDRALTGDDANRLAYSASVNVLYSPITAVTFGVELMRGVRELEGGQKGMFDRFQFSAKYDFDWSNTVQKG